MSCDGRLPTSSSWLLLWNAWMWLRYAAYGVNNQTSLVFLVVLYAISILLYAGSRVYRRQHGVKLAAIHCEIPVE